VGPPLDIIWRPARQSYSMTLTGRKSGQSWRVGEPGTHGSRFAWCTRAKESPSSPSRRETPPYPVR
jgi:hypothetical protein